jgi:uncharacterized membrane protein YeaQ/YmgE (transglycosylase-associated protein family)
MDLLIWLGIWIVLGAMLGVIPGLVLPKAPPYGREGDIVFAVATTVIWGLLFHYLLAMVDMPTFARSVIKIVEPVTTAGMVLWLLRLLHRRQSGD